MENEAAVSLKEIPLELVKDPTLPIRLQMGDDAMYDLVESMRKIGLVQPIVVVPVEGGYEVLAGHRRLVAARRLKWTVIRAIIMPKVYEYGDVVKLHENIIREDVHPIDEAAFLHELKERLNVTADKLAAMIFKSPAYVYEKLAMKDWPPDVIKALGEGEIIYSVAREFAKIGDDPVRSEYLRFAKEGGCNWQTAKKWREGWERDKLERTAQPPEPDEPTRPAKPDIVFMPCFACKQPSDITKTTMIRLCEVCFEKVEHALVEGTPKVAG
jgi:ParB family chromosome partitioning protein